MSLFTGFTTSTLGEKIAACRAIKNDLTIEKQRYKAEFDKELKTFNDHPDISEIVKEKLKQQLELTVPKVRVAKDFNLFKPELDQIRKRDSGANPSLQSTTLTF